MKSTRFFRTRAFGVVFVLLLALVLGGCPSKPYHTSDGMAPSQSQPQPQPQQQTGFLQNLKAGAGVAWGEVKTGFKTAFRGSRGEQLSDEAAHCITMWYNEIALPHAALEGGPRAMEIRSAWGLKEFQELTKEYLVWYIKTNPEKADIALERMKSYPEHDFRMRETREFRRLQVYLENHGIPEAKQLIAKAKQDRAAALAKAKQ